MPYQNIDATVTAATAQEIKEALKSIRQKLPFLIHLQGKDRRRLVKSGGDSLSFVQNALAAARHNPEILPASFQTAGFTKDVDLFTVLTELNTQVAQLASQIDDTRMAVGSEAMQASMQVYQYVKTLPGLKPVAEQLGERFQHSKITAAAEIPAPEPVAS